MTPNSLIEELKTAIIRWYPFEDEAKIAYIGEEDVIFSMLKECYKAKVTLISPGELPERKADYIICIKYIELLQDAASYLEKLAGSLKPSGKLLLGVNNRLGIRYFCGDRDPYTERSFDGIENYRRAYSKAEDSFAGRAYDRDQLRNMLWDAGFINLKQYSVFPDLDNGTLIYADGFLPNEDLSCRIFPEYNYNRAVFLEEAPLYQTLMDNGMFHVMANAFLFECALSDETVLSDALHITSSIRRGWEDALITVLHENETVSRQAAYPEGEKRILRLKENEEKLNARGIKTVPGELVDGRYVMPLIKEETGQAYLKRLLYEDKEKFLREMDAFRDIILKSSDSHQGIYTPELTKEEQEKSKKKKLEILEENKQPAMLMNEAFLDLVPLNSFHIDGEYVFYDQEFCEKNYPQNVMFDRMISSFFTGNADFSRIVTHEELQKRYGIYDEYSRWHHLETRFIWKLRNDLLLSEHDKSVRADFNSINANRQRMNYSADDYQRLFVDIFEYADTRKLILFGSGIFARRFLTLYGQDYKVYAVVDNNEKRWGERLYPEGFEPADSDAGDADGNGVVISSPEILGTLRHGEYKIIICIKNYLSVMKQLDDLGISEYSIFDPAKAYQRKRYPISREAIENFENSTVPEGGKKYHVGYVAGVFDLYHVGHLNMFRRAKEMCDYLIVGVVSDEGVRRFKQVDPFVPFDERIEMVKSCRYVDEVVEIPYMYGGTEDAWRMHHFDVQFSGSDYVNDPNFEKYREFLEKHGASLEFFPYTQSTSSTKLKGLIDKKLI